MPTFPARGSNSHTISWFEQFGFSYGMVNLGFKHEKETLSADLLSSLGPPQCRLSRLAQCTQFWRHSVRPRPLLVGIFYKDVYVIIRFDNQSIVGTYHGSRRVNRAWNKQVLITTTHHLANVRISSTTWDIQESTRTIKSASTRSKSRKRWQPKTQRKYISMFQGNEDVVKWAESW